MSHDMQQVAALGRRNDFSAMEAALRRSYENEHEQEVNLCPLRRRIKEDRIQQLHAEVNDNEEAGWQDPLLDLIQVHREKAIGFIRVTMLVSILTAVIIGTPCFVFLLENWTACGSCNKPLKWWLLVYAIMQFAQVPVRVFACTRLQGEPLNVHDFKERVRRLTESPVWRASKHVSVATYIWFLFGLIWLINNKPEYCASCPGLYRLSLGVVLISTSRLLFTMGFLSTMGFFNTLTLQAFHNLQRLKPLLHT